MSFDLHPQLKKDCLQLGDLTLCRLLLMNDKRYPWFILVPLREDTREVFELNTVDQAQLNNESCALASFLMRLFHGEKMNIAALGNIVPQLHIHHIVRYAKDSAWPAPVWGKSPAVAYSDREVAEIRKKIQPLLDQYPGEANSP